MKILVTGGSGFIGTRLISKLLNDKNIELINFDKRMSDRHQKITIIGDVRNYHELFDAAEGVDLIVNLAAEHADNVTPTSLYHDVNVGGAENVVRVANDRSIKKIIFTSSVAIYGLNRGNPDEKTSPKPFNDYGFSKLKAEKCFDNWITDVEGGTLITIRPSVVFGEGNRGNVHNLISQIDSGKFVMIGNGSNKKSMAYVGNIASFIKNLVQSKIVGRHVFNYADKDDLSSSQIVNIIKNQLGSRALDIKLPYFLGVIVGHSFDLITKITGRKFPVSAVRINKFCAETTVDSSSMLAFGFNAPYSLEDGLRKMIINDFVK